MQRTQIILIDGDFRRRAKVSFELTDLQHYVIPLEDVAEICDAWPDRAVFLVEDRADNLPRLNRMFRRVRSALPFIAFSASVDARRRAAVRRQGAVAYLEWPATRSAVSAALQEALARLDQAAEGGQDTKVEQVAAAQTPLDHPSFEQTPIVGVGSTGEGCGEYLIIPGTAPTGTDLPGTQEPELRPAEA